MISSQELKELLTEEQICHILARLGSSEFRDGGKYLTFKTICHNLDESQAKFNLIYYKDTRLFRCFSECSDSFDIYGLVKRRFDLENEGQDTHKDNLFYFVLNYSDIDFDNYIEEKVYNELSSQYSIKPIEVVLPEYSNHILDVFNKQYCAEWLNDGITPAAMDKYGIKYSIGQNKIIIPHHDAAGRLIGIRGRALNKETEEKYGKYGPIYIEGKMYNHPLGLNLYGLFQAKEAISKTGIAILAEGEKSCLQAEALLPYNVVCSTCGSAVNRWQVLLLLRYCNVNEIIIAFDREEKGNEDKYFNKLYNICQKYKHYCNFSFIYDNQLLEMKESPFDAGKDVLSQLIKKRVVIK